MHTLSFIVGVVGNLISVLVFASPIVTFWRVVNNRSTEEFEGLPYVCILLSSSLWTYYGFTKPGAILVATVNCVGIVLEFIYVTLFLIYSPPRTRVQIASLVAILDVGFLGGVILVTRLAIHGKLRIDVIGFICAGLSMCMYGSPLAAMRTVITTKSVGYMPFFLSFFLFLNGAVWTFYSYLERDFFVGYSLGSSLYKSPFTHAVLTILLVLSTSRCEKVPNGIGFLLGTAQLILYAIYRNTKATNQTQIVDGMEESSQPFIRPLQSHDCDERHKCSDV